MPEVTIFDLPRFYLARLPDFSPNTISSKFIIRFGYIWWCSGASFLCLQPEYPKTDEVTNIFDSEPSTQGSLTTKWKKGLKIEMNRFLSQMTFSHHKRKRDRFLWFPFWLRWRCLRYVCPHPESCLRFFSLFYLKLLLLSSEIQLALPTESAHTFASTNEGADFRLRLMCVYLFLPETPRFCEQFSGESIRHVVPVHTSLSHSILVNVRRTRLQLKYGESQYGNRGGRRNTTWLRELSCARQMHSFSILSNHINTVFTFPHPTYYSFSSEAPPASTCFS